MYFLNLLMYPIPMIALVSFVLRVSVMSLCFSVSPFFIVVSKIGSESE